MFWFWKKREEKLVNEEKPGTSRDNPLVFNLRFIDSPDGVFFIPGNVDNTGNPFRVRGDEGNWRVPTKNARSEAHGFSFAIPFSKIGNPKNREFLNEVRSFTKKEIISELSFPVVDPVRFGMVTYYFRYEVPENIMEWARILNEYLKKTGKIRSISGQ